MCFAPRSGSTRGRTGTGPKRLAVSISVLARSGSRGRRGSPAIGASELWREHGSRLRAGGVDALWLWDGSGWLGYAVDALGRVVPGSTDFELSDSTELHYSSGSTETRALVRIDPAAVQQGPLAGILQERHILGDPHAPVLIIDYSDFL